jgi:hypothetical protein
MFQVAFWPVWRSAKNVHSKTNRVERPFPAAISLRQPNWVMTQSVEMLEQQL